jgi:DNA ligase (NAD+)
MNEALDQKFLEHIAHQHKTTMMGASLLINKCIEQVCANKGLKYSDVYDIIFSAENIRKCVVINGNCSALEFEECEKSCACFYLQPYGCLPRKIQDADIINKNPDKYIMEKLGKIEDLKKMVEIAAYLYYNYTGGGLTDNSFDALEYYLKKKEKVKGRLYEKVGAMPIEKIRVDLTYHMASLNKVKPESIECVNFLSRFSVVPGNTEKDCCWSLKLDGTSGQLTYNNGKLISIHTRGNGMVGGDVTYLKDFMKTIPLKIPFDQSGDVVIRGEFILPKLVWETRYVGSYSNARAFVSGKINGGFMVSAIQDIQFLAYKIMKNGNAVTTPEPSRSFKILTYWGFLTPENGILKNPTVFDVIQLYTEKRKSAQYFIDGLVLDEDIIGEPSIAYSHMSNMTVSNPVNTVAFKMQLQEQIRDTIVTDIQWNISRYGKLIPVVIFEAVYIDGARVTRASGHNARKIQDWNMGRGTKIKVARSGDVIPQIKDVDVDYHIPIVFPDEKANKYHWEKHDLILDDIEGNKFVHIKRIVYFFETIGVPRLREKTVEKFYNAGMTTPESITKASIKNMEAIKGIGKKSAQGFYDSIRDVMSKIPPDRFIEASTTFKAGIGRKLLKQLFRYVPNILNMNKEEIEKTLKKVKIPGFGPKRIENVALSIPSFKKYLDGFSVVDIDKSINYYMKKLEDMKKRGYNPLIENKKFVLTGFMGNVDYELEDFIYENMGDFSVNVTSDVSAVICGNLEKVSTKMSEAYGFKIPVLTIREFSDKFNVPLKRFEKLGEKDEDEEDED